MPSSVVSSKTASEAASAAASPSATSWETFAPTDWPPSKATWIRTEFSDTDYLRENAVQRVGMDERDEMAAETGTRLAVEHLGALGRELVDGGGDVGDPDADVVHAGAARGEEPADMGVGPERGDELDAPLAEPQVDRL